MHIRREDGMALLIAMMIMLLMTALGVALIMTTTSETIISSNFQNSGEGLYAADAVVERAVDDLLTVPDWNSVLNADPTQITRSAFVDGAPTGSRTLPDGTKIDLGESINVANCGHAASCTVSEMEDTSKPGRPWGKNNPRWSLYAYGNLRDMMPTDTISSQYYVMVFVADDPSENDLDPFHDGAASPSGNPNLGKGILALRAEAFGPRGAHKVLEITVKRTDTAELERGYTGQRGQDEQNRRARKAAVGTPGKALAKVSRDL